MTTFRAVAFVALCFAVSLVQAETLPTYTLTNLGILPGHDDSEAYGISPTMTQVVGASFNEALDRTANFLYTPHGGVQAVSINAPGVRLLASDVNDSGQVVVGGFDNNGGWQSFIWQNGTTTQIGTVDSRARARAINNQGVAVGYQELSSGSPPFVWTATEGLKSVTVFNSNDAPLFDINRHGIAVGIFKKGSNYHSYLLDTNTLQATDLGNFGFPASSYLLPRAINDEGELTAHGYFNGRSYFVDATGQAVDLGSLLGGGTYAYDLNNQGIVVGISGNSAFRWDATNKMVNLDTVTIAPQGWHVLEAHAIDEWGQIVGTGVFRGVNHAILLTPVPEPTTIVLAGVGGLLLLLVARRRQR